MYSKITHDVSVTVEPIFLKEGSKPEEEVFLWAYHVRITNNRAHSVHLKRRHWRITDCLGYTQEISGVGVIGEQPVILPDSTYEYASGTILAAPSGLMMGTYEMETEDHAIIMVDIPPFSLDSPYEKGCTH